MVMNCEQGLPCCSLEMHVKYCDLGFNFFVC
jgi:hypothetical protein